MLNYDGLSLEQCMSMRLFFLLPLTTYSTLVLAEKNLFGTMRLVITKDFPEGLRNSSFGEGPWGNNQPLPTFKVVNK